MNTEASLMAMRAEQPRMPDSSGVPAAIGSGAASGSTDAHMGPSTALPFSRSTCRRIQPGRVSGRCVVITSVDSEDARSSASRRACRARASSPSVTSSSNSMAGLRTSERATSIRRSWPCDMAVTGFFSRCTPPSRRTIPYAVSYISEVGCCAM